MFNSFRRDVGIWALKLIQFGGIFVKNKTASTTLSRECAKRTKGVTLFFYQNITEFKDIRSHLLDYSEQILEVGFSYILATILFFFWS